MLGRASHAQENWAERCGPGGDSLERLSLVEGCFSESSPIRLDQIPSRHDSECPLVHWAPKGFHLSPRCKILSKPCCRVKEAATVMAVGADHSLAVGAMAGSPFPAAAATMVVTTECVDL